MSDIIHAIIGIPIVIVGMLVIAAIDIGAIIGMFYLARLLRRLWKV